MRFLWPGPERPLDSLCDGARQGGSTTEVTSMLDAILIALAGGLFLLAVAYVHACDRL
jgi:hypothetical protein